MFLLSVEFQGDDESWLAFELALAAADSEVEGKPHGDDEGGSFVH